jgi:GrpB-like predicted nucleotidyltransferase (UPF0157 family)
MGCSTKIVPYHARWPWAFIEGGDRIAVALGPLALRIGRHGSTSVVGLAAKPVIDIQISVGTLHPLDRYITPLAVLGYVHVPDQDDAFCLYFHTRQLRAKRAVDSRIRQYRSKALSSAFKDFHDIPPFAPERKNSCALGTKHGDMIFESSVIHGCRY